MKKMLFSIFTLIMLLAGICLQDGLAQDIITISGNVKSGGAALAGVRMSGLPGNPVTDLNGNYSAEAPSGWSGTVKPQKIGYAIHPFTRVYTEVTSPIQQNYTATVLPKMAVVLDKVTIPTTYYVGEPIMVTLTIQNQGTDIITTQGFGEKDFTLGLRFTDPDGNLITANLPEGAVLPTPPPPPSISIPGAEAIQADYVEIVPQGWAWSTVEFPFNALDSYTLAKAGNYSLIAKFSMSDYLDYYETASGSGVYYSPLESGSSGDVESNVVTFTLLSFGTAAKLIFSTEPTNTTAGQIISTIRVEVQDEFGNLVTSSTAPVTLAIANNPGGGTLSGTTSKAAVGGVATFSNLSIDKAGDGYTLTASSPNVTAATSSAFNITAGAGTKLAFGVQPSNTTVGVTIGPPVTVRILDSNGNLTSSTAAVTLTIGNNPGGGTLSGTKTRNAVNGVATFGDLSINKVGNGYTLVASSSGITGATSSAFNITIYNFTGFDAPVANPPSVNTVVAASTVPVKWRITDTKGVGVSDPGSFVNLTSSQVSCKNWRSPKDTRSESTGLVYLGDGNWKFEWKTLKNFSDTCRIMTIKLKDGTEHEARFQFVK